MLSGSQLEPPRKPSSGAQPLAQVPLSASGLPTPLLRLALFFPRPRRPHAVHLGACSPHLLLGEPGPVPLRAGGRGRSQGSCPGPRMSVSLGGSWRCPASSQAWGSPGRSRFLLPEVTALDASGRGSCRDRGPRGAQGRGAPGSAPRWLRVCGGRGRRSCATWAAASSNPGVRAFDALEPQPPRLRLRW